LFLIIKIKKILTFPQKVETKKIIFVKIYKEKNLFVPTQSGLINELNEKTLKWLRNFTKLLVENLTTIKGFIF